MHIHLLSMRSYLFCLFLSLSIIKLFAQRSQAKFIDKEDIQHGHILKTNILSPLLGTINFHYEWKLTPNSSSQIEAYYFTGQFFGQSIPLSGFGVTYNYRYYLTGTFPTGFFVQPYIRYQQFLEKNGVSGLSSSSTITTPLLAFTVYGTGLVLGYQFVFAKRVSLDFYGGPMYNVSYENGVRTNSQDYPPFFTGPFLRTGCTLGFIF